MDRRGAALRPLPHFTIRLDTVDRVAVLEEHLGQNPGSGADVGDDRLRRQSAFGLQRFQDGLRVSGPVIDIVLDPVRKPLRWAARLEGCPHGVLQRPLGREAFESLEQLTRAVEDDRDRVVAELESF